MKYILLILSVLSVSLVLLTASPVSAALPNPLSEGNVADLINRILNEVVTKIAPPIVAIMILVGAFQILFAGGEPERFTTGKKTIIYAVVGYAILLLALGISSIIKEILGAA